MNSIVTLPVHPRPRDTLDRPLHDLRISVMDRCNFRCPYCMPRETFHEHYRFLKANERLSFEEITRLTRLFVQLGVQKVRLTGGEPLLRPNISELVGELTALEGVQDVALTTNGVLLAQHAAELKANGLHRITVSLDTLDPEIFKQMSGGFDELDRVLAGLRAASAAGLAPIKINCVVERGLNDHTLLDLIGHFRGTGIIVRFIEYMDVGSSNRWRLQDVMTAAEIIQKVNAWLPVAPIQANYPGEVAGRWRYQDGSGELGVIASVTQPFCRACTRARLATDGRLYTCLFAAAGHDLRALLRTGASDQQLVEALAGIWAGRADRYSEQRASYTPSHTDRRRIEMSYIGG
jgi:GTP 3',8-cyclase